MEEIRIMSNEDERAMLESSYAMYESSKAETLKKRRNKLDKDGKQVYSEKSTEDIIQLMNTMQQDIVDQYKKLGGTEEELVNSVNKNTNKAKRKKDIAAILKSPLKNNSVEVTSSEENAPTTETKSTKGSELFETLKRNKTETPKINGNVMYDTIPLPSKGKCYGGLNAESLPVAYLTANDENLIVSPNLYKDGLFLDYLIQSKLLSNKISADDLLPGDRDAIVIWLRASGYGPMFPVQVTDPTTNDKFESVVDLSKLEYKKFDLEADENGYFEFILPKSNDTIKFKYLSYGDIKTLAKMEQSEAKDVYKIRVNKMISELEDIIQSDEDGDKTLKRKAMSALTNLSEYAESLSEEEGFPYTHAVTNRLISSIMEINGITDRDYIYNYVQNMNVADSSALRSYISRNEPGIDFNIEIERPESLGGGSMTMFLSLDQYLFLNVE